MDRIDGLEGGGVYFSYTAEEAEYLAYRDKKLGAAMAAVGPVRRTMEPEIFPALVHQIVGQQISGAALRSVWRQFCEGLGSVTAENILRRGAAGLVEFGISLRKAEYIAELAQKYLSGEFDAESLRAMSDDDAAAYLCRLRGVGLWTAEMLLIFTLGRKDVLSFGDFGIKRGMRMLYRHREIDRAHFERYRRRYSPCGTLASLYLWEIAGGALAELDDPAVKAARGAKSLTRRKKSS